MNRGLRVLAFTIASVFAIAAVAAAATHAKADPALLSALRSDRELGRCACVLAAAWIDASYPRVTVDAARWKTLDRAARAQFSVRALQVAEATSPRELGIPDQYQQIFIYDGRDRLLATYQP